MRDETPFQFHGVTIDGQANVPTITNEAPARASAFRSRTARSGKISQSRSAERHAPAAPDLRRQGVDLPKEKA